MISGIVKRSLKNGYKGTTNYLFLQTAVDKIRFFVERYTKILIFYTSNYLISGC